MFHPTSNRLAGFLEISALSIQLAQSGGWQAKAGMLAIESASKKSGGFGRRNSSFVARKRQKWSALRESYLVAVEEPGEAVVYDVFLLDSDFKIERPKRYYRQGFHILQHSSTVDQDSKGMWVKPSRHDAASKRGNDDDDDVGTLRKVKAKMSRALHFRVGSISKSWKDSDRHSTTVASIGRGRGHERIASNVTRSRSSSSSSSSSGSSIESERTGRGVVDPSTNVDPMQSEDEHSVHTDATDQPSIEKEEKQQRARKSRKAKGRKKVKDVSKHTFFISNSQMRLKLFAKNVVSEFWF